MRVANAFGVSANSRSNSTLARRLSLFCFAAIRAPKSSSACGGSSPCSAANVSSTWRSDLHVLETFAAEHGELPPQALEDFGARIAAKQNKLRRRANVEFERLFAETPNAFATRIAAYLGHPVREPEVAEDEPAKAVSAA